MRADPYPQDSTPWAWDPQVENSAAKLSRDHGSWGSAGGEAVLHEAKRSHDWIERQSLDLAAQSLLGPLYPSVLVRVTTAAMKPHD